MYDELAKTESSVGTTRQADFKARLTGELERINQRKKEIEEALVLIDKNPDVERLLSLMGRSIF